MRHAGELRALLGELLAKAQRRGVVRAGIDEADLHAIALGALAAEQHRADAQPGRLTALICDGLRPPSEESVQRGLSSPHAVPGPLSAEEDAVDQIVTMIARGYQGPPVWNTSAAASVS